MNKCKEIIKHLKEKHVLTVKEICLMIDNDILHFDQSTQRRFIYADIKTTTEDGEVSKAGSVIRSILQLGVQLPAVFFWEKEDGSFNIHDGKQRILSLYYFINSDKGIAITTRINGKEFTWGGLDKKSQDKLNNYELNIVLNKGQAIKEEESFYVINTNAVPLTDYESLRGMFYGQWIYDFENFITQLSGNIDAVRKINRGDQAIIFLDACFKRNNNKEAYMLNLKENLRLVRNNKFNEKDYHLYEIIKTFARLLKIIKKAKESTLIQVAKFIIFKKWDQEKIFDYYTEAVSKNNDIQKWQLATHITAITRLIQNNIKCDGRRFFSHDEKAILFEKHHRCQYVGCKESNFTALEVDHMIPWSKGGPTTLNNAQLLCKKHNTSKNDKDTLRDDELYF